MKDLYQTLGITKEASPQEIRKAYRTLSLSAHPDKGGDVAVMALLNEAYETLFDPTKRRDFDAKWNAYQAADVENEPDVVFDGYLQAGNILPYSHSFRTQHEELVKQYEHTPLMQNATRDNVPSFESDLYHFEEEGSAVKQCHDIFTFIRVKTARTAETTLTIPSEPLTPVLAITLLMDFLSGNYYGANLIKINSYFASEINTLKARNPQASELLLYTGIFEIFLLTDKASIEQANLILSIKKITDFAKKSSDVLLASIIPLFYNKFFRNLYAYSLHLYWQSSDNVFLPENLNQFDGYQETKELLSILKERLSSGSHNENLTQLTQYIKLLFNFEKDLHESSLVTQTADNYRELAFHSLDWIPTFIEQSSRQILVNIFLQIGIKFQQASRLEIQPTIKMADEKLALKMYLTAVGIGHHSTPDVEIYANTLTLKYISALQFQDEMLPEIISALKKCTLIIADVFPFFDSHQSNVAFLRQENKMIHLMRQLLNAMIKIYEYNKTHSDGISIDHSAVTLLYQAYEACLKNWYQEEYDPAIEKQFRLDLMEELLFDNAWTFLDVEQKIDSPYIMVDRDPQGWMRPTDSLPYPEEPELGKYRSINGAEVNHKTGEINFFMTPWTKDRPIYEKVFTLFDLHEMLEKNISGAIFSLDPVDPDKPYHPFNLMRFSPSQLCDSELLNTMLLTDYVLKFLTTNQEVQGQYPFEQRPVHSMIKHLPLYLRKIIEDFHVAQHSAGALHRFWIEAEKIDISLSNEVLQKEGLMRVKLGDLKMIVKKHRMERDIHGELKDVGNEDEGWPIYALTPEQFLALKQGSRVITGHAMVFIYAETKLFYWENNQITKAHIPEDYSENLIRLYKQPKDIDGKVIQNTDNMPLMVRVTKEMARQSGLSHRYSPEFIFAHEFTRHYDEFAQYLPEFGRLKELSKMSALIRYLNHIRESNQESIKALDSLLGSIPPSVPPEDEPYPITQVFQTAFQSMTSLFGSLFGITQPSLPPETESYRQYKQGVEKVCENVTSRFDDWRRDLSSSVLQRKWREELKRIKNEIGSFTFSNYSTEVEEACQRWHDDISMFERHLSSRRIWDEVINPKRSEVAQQLSTSKLNSCKSQLRDIFSARLSASLGSAAFDQLIDSFLQGDIYPLADALMNQEKIQAQQTISKQFPNRSITDIALAIDDAGQAAAKRIATEESKDQLIEQKGLNNQLEAGFVRIDLGKHEEPINLEGKCFWVPASVRHEVRKDAATGQTRYSFFVYGGVNIQPRINVVQGGNGPLAGNRVGVAQIVQNKIQGDLFRDQLAQQLRAAGREVHIEVTKKTPFGRRFMDIEIRANGVPIGGIEAKTGNSRYTPSQRAKDEWLGMNGYPVNLARQRK